MTSPGRWWLYWVAFGFAVAITFRAVHLFGVHHLLGPEWERRQVERRLVRSRGAAS
jgi:hypothetical protein